MVVDRASRATCSQGMNKRNTAKHVAIWGHKKEVSRLIEIKTTQRRIVAGTPTAQTHPLKQEFVQAKVWHIRTPRQCEHSGRQGKPARGGGCKDCVRDPAQNPQWHPTPLSVLKLEKPAILLKCGVF